MQQSFKFPKMHAFVCLIFLTSFFTLVSAQIKTLPNGDNISYDGEYYDFRDSAGVQMIKMWIPPGIKPVKGVFISGHGGGGGDSRNFARDENIRAFAMRLGFAVAGLHNFPGRRAYEQGANVFFKTLQNWAEMGHHPELANLPFVMYGSSNGGAATYGFVNFAPERAICFVSNVGAGGQPEIPVDAALRVPGIFIIGKFDALIGQRGIDRTSELIKNGRQKGARWAWALELKGHEDGTSFDVYMKLVEQAVEARYPKNGNPAEGIIRLNDIPEESGWLVDQSSWDKGITYIDAFPVYKGNKQDAGWVLNQDMAYVYRSMATHHNPITLSVKEFDRTYNPNTDPGTMFSLGGPVTNPGENITINIQSDAFPDWEEVEIFNGSDKLGEVKRGSKAEISVKLNEKPKVYCLTALVTNKNGDQRTCPAMHFFVKDPKLSWKTELPVPRYNKSKTNSGAYINSKSLPSVKSNPTDSVLIAYALSSELEKQFSSEDKKVSDFWKLIDGNKDIIKMTVRANAPSDAAFNPVITHDCQMQVKAAYGADGIYLLYEITDDNDVAWPNRFAGTENEQFYLDFDVVDVLMDSRSEIEISDPENKNLMVSRSFGLSFTTRQYQIACGTEKERPLGFRRSLADPWDFSATYYTFTDAKKQFGLEVENIKTGYFEKAQECFIPWSEYGAGFSSQPETGTRLCFSPGYNDRDEGEHFPPGVTSSGGSVKASNSIRWIGKTNPWGNSIPPYSWGEIVLGELLK